jgi:hypothetical protein
MAATTQIRFEFFCVPSAHSGAPKLSTYCRDIVTYADAIWNVKPPPSTGGPVSFFWDGSIKSVSEQNDEYKLIEFYITKGDKALKLVKENWASNPDAVIPVFLCWAAWDQLGDGGTVPHPGQLEGFTVTRKGVPWFKGDRAILLFLATAGQDTLAHELSHWFGFSHRDVDGDPELNVGRNGGGGRHILNTQYRKMIRWATESSFRASVG